MPGIFCLQQYNPSPVQLAPPRPYWDELTVFWLTKMTMASQMSVGWMHIRDKEGDICVVYAPVSLTHSCMKYGWCGLRRLCPTVAHNDRNVWCVRHRAQTVMGPSLRLSSSSDINCNFAVLNYTTQHISIRLNTGRLPVIGGEFLTITSM